MKNHSLLVPAIFLTLSAFSQQTAFYNDPDEKLREAKQYFQKEQYSLAYPIFRELSQTIRETDRVNRPITVQEIEYYTVVCGLKQNEARAEELAREYIEVEKSNARVQMMNFHLGEYYFRHERFADAVARYEEANLGNLSNREIAEMKFHQGYAYFNLQQFARAKPLFNSVRSLKKDPNYFHANYYYGFLAFRDRQYGEALESFRVVENDKTYAPIVPYYIAQIHYTQGRKDEALAYAESKIRSGESQYYDLELKQMVGHAYFEKKQYEKALQYLEDYVRGSRKVRREDLYELSYAYYQTGQLNKAIEGFRQLSGREDSLSQHAMYLLGDAYLKTGQKSNARNAFLFGASNNSNQRQKEISRFQYAKLSYELGYQDEALNSLRSFLNDYPNSQYQAEARELLIDVLANTNNYRDALTLMEGLPRMSENAKRLYPRILFGRATEMINDGQLAQADVLLTRVLYSDYNASVLPFAYFWKGEIGYRSRQLDTAIKYYQAYATYGSPPAGEANATNVKYNLGYAYLRKENYPVSMNYFQGLMKAPALNSDAFSQDVYLRVADNHFMMKNFAQARSMYETVIRLSWPAEDYATFQIAMLAGVRSSAEKISLMNNMTRKFPNSPLVLDANMEIANTYMSDEKFREAIPYLGNVINNPTGEAMKPQAYLKLGIAYFNINQNQDALKQFSTLVDRYPNAPEVEDALDQVRAIYVEEGKPGEYADFMRRAGRPISISSEDSLTYYAAEQKYDEQKLNEALSAFNEYLQKFPNGSYALDAQFNRGEIYAARKDWNNALAALDAVMAEAPNKYAERAAVAASRISFFELKDYPRAEDHYTRLKQLASGQENRLEAMRGLLRSQYQLKKWGEALENAKELAAAKGASADDKALANMTIARSHQVAGQPDLALAAFRQVVQVNKGALAAEARYEIANSLFLLDKLTEAEKAAFETINKSGSYDYWVTRSYLLLGEIYFRQKDYFNAKATFQSIVDNSLNAELKNEAQARLSAVIEEENRSSKVNN